YRRARTTVTSLYRGRAAHRVGAADRPSPAGRLAGGALPWHSDGAVRSADGGASPTRADAPRPATRRGPATRHDARTAARNTAGARRPERALPLGRRPHVSDGARDHRAERLADGRREH